jgi:hypothetical protein
MTELKALVDFNNIRGGCVKTLLRYVEGPRPINVGARVLAHDDGEEEESGSVEAIERELVTIRLDPLR